MKKSVSKLWYRITYRFIKPRLVITQASFSGDESFIDIRYWLSRPDKLNFKISPYLLTACNQKIGLMHFSKFGVIKTKMHKHTNTGIILFYNMNHSVSKGDIVTMYWDSFKIDHIEVK
jgi:hypothetical protein